MKGLFIFVCLLYCVCLWNCNAQHSKEVALYGTNNNSTNTTANISCSSWSSIDGTNKSVVTVKGEDVLFSDLVDPTASLKNFCNISKESNNRDVVLMIFAIKSFIIDEDLDGKDLDMVVISPTWVVIGHRKISLDGSRGERKASHDLNRTYVCNNWSGFNGTSGDVGKPGGAFLGVGETFINGRNLTITSNGGDGGPGSGGGNGGDGRPGLAPIHVNGSSTNCQTVKQCNQNKTMKMFYTGPRCHKPNNLGPNCTRDFHCSGEKTVDSKTSKVVCRIEVFGLPGEVGYDGGRGGAGGPGGYPGEIDLIQLSGKSEVLLQNRAGHPGLNGKGGPGGKGALRGNSLVYSVLEDNGTVVHRSTEEIKAKERNNPGRSNKQQPKPLVNQFLPKNQTFGPPQVDRIVLEYRDFLREHLRKADSFKNKYLTPFFSQLDGNTFTKRCSMYSVDQLLDDLRQLEEDYHKFNRPADFLRLYETLLDKIRAQMDPSCWRDETRQLSKDETDPVKLQNVTLTHGKDPVKLQNVTLTDGKGPVKPQNVTLTHGKDPVQSHNMTLLRYLYTATLGRVYNMRDHTDTVVVTDIGEYLNSAQKIVLELKQVKGERDKFLMVISKLNMVKMDLGKYINAKYQIVENFINTEILPLIGQVKTMTRFKLDIFYSIKPSIIQTDVDDIITLSQENGMEAIQSLILYGYLGVLKYVAKALSFIPFVGAVMIARPMFSVSSEEFIFNFNYSDDVVVPEFRALEMIYNGWKETYNNQTTKHNNGDKALKNTEMNLAFGYLEIARHFKNDKNKLNALKWIFESKIINTFFPHLKKVKAQQDIIREIMKPTLKMMGESMKSVAKSLKDNSDASIIDITKWQIKTTLRQLKIEMEKLKEVNLANIIYAKIAAMYEVFDLIEDFQEQLNLANYMAAVGAAGATDVNVTNPRVRNITHHLQLMISSNLVLQKYQESVNAFKQFVFPFAQLYFQGLTLPASIRVGDSLEDLINTAASQVNHLVKRLNDYKQTIKKQDEMIGVGKFSSGFKSTTPFYAWKNTNHRDTISKLLSCQEVILQADVKYSPKHKDAIKFNVIDFSFVVTKEHKQLQSKLDELLKTFEVMATHAGMRYPII